MIKKVYIVLMLSVIAFAAVAQDVTTTTTSEEPALKSKRGFTILPQTDEWGLGISADPFFRYIGNMFNANDDNGGPSFDFANNPTKNLGDNIAVFGKLMKDENTAYRVRFNISVGTDINKSVVEQNLINYDPTYPAFTEDWQKVSNTTVVIAPGFEKRRGKSRVQGIYGGELVLGLNSTKVQYDYGNAISMDFQNPNRTDFGSNDLGNAWVTEDKSGTNFIVGARGFVGVEYFFAPKISLGGEFGYMLAFQTQSKGSAKYEFWNDDTNAVHTIESDKYENDGLSSIGLGLDNLNASINLLFYF